MANHPLKYDIDYIEQGAVHFEDYIDASFYLIEGDEKAMLIDTGCGGGNVRRLASAFTDKPMVLAVTHAHGDHDAHANEFETAYLHVADIDRLEEMNRHFGVSEEEALHAQDFVAIRGGDVIDLGNCPVRVFEMPGHTPGSVVFVDEKHRLVFTGDAIGSGVGVWMQLRGCPCLSQYRKDLEKLKTELEPYREYTFLGGHYRQGGTPGTPDYHPASYRMLEDLVTLCDLVLSGEIKGTEYAPVGRFADDEVTLIASYGEAALVYLPSYVK